MRDMEVRIGGERMVRFSLVRADLEAPADHYRRASEFLATQAERGRAPWMVGATAATPSRRASAGVPGPGPTRSGWGRRPSHTPPTLGTSRKQLRSGTEISFNCYFYKADLMRTLDGYGRTSSRLSRTRKDFMGRSWGNTGSEGKSAVRKTCARYSLGPSLRSTITSAEYRWETKQVAELIEDLAEKFRDDYQSGDPRSAVEDYGHYFLGSIIISDRDGRKFIIDGQQRLTTLLLLIHIYVALRTPNRKPRLPICNEVRPGVRSTLMSERAACMEALFTGSPFEESGQPESASFVVSGT